MSCGRWPTAFDVPIGRPMLPTKIVFLEHGLKNFSAARARWIAPLGAENFHGGRRAKKGCWHVKKAQSARLHTLAQESSCWTEICAMASSAATWACRTRGGKASRRSRRTRGRGSSEASTRRPPGRTVTACKAQRPRLKGGMACACVSVQTVL